MDARTTAAHDSAHLRAILRLGAPLVVNNLAYSGMLFADTVMSGHIGADASPRWRGVTPRSQPFHEPFTSR